MKSTLTHYHPKPIVHMGFTLCVVHSVGFDKCIMTCIHHHSIIHKLPCPKNSVFHLVIPFFLFLLSPSEEPLLFHCLHSFVFSKMSVIIIQYVTFSDWLLSLINRHLRSFLWLHSSCLFSTEKHSIVWMYHDFYFSVKFTTFKKMDSKFWLIRKAFRMSRLWRNSPVFF